MQAIIKGLEKVKQELAASEDDGPVSEGFRETLKDFTTVAETEAGSLHNLYTVVVICQMFDVLFDTSSNGRNADALALYFGEDPARCPFEQVTVTILKFVKLFQKALEENVKQDELEKKKALKDAEMEKAAKKMLLLGTQIELQASNFDWMAGYVSNSLVLVQFHPFRDVIYEARAMSWWICRT
ncbi:hypothetical protein GOBAR_DD32963 [Gossypium barbadense]|nr:hypothetical protein GOBAR_DD32963 [Gossypium barbadense]